MPTQRPLGQAATINNKVFLRTVAALVVPMALQNLINVGVQAADVVMLGRVSEVVLSAASLAGQIQFVMTLIFFGLASGASVLTAQYWGKGDTRTIEKIFAIALRLSFLVALVFFLAAELFPHALMRLFTPEAELIAEGARYLRFVAPSYLIVSFTNVYLTILRSVERVVVSTVVYLISLVVNVVLNSVLIFGLLGFPAMGITGAALATSLARVVELIIVIWYAATNTAVRLKRKDFFARHRVLFADFMRYSLPTVLNEMVWAVAIAANTVIIGHLGTAVVAANSVTQVVRQLATVLCFGVANAAAILIGKSIGAGDVPNARGYASRMLGLAVGAGGLGSGVILCLRPILPNILSLSPAAADYLRFMLLVLAFYVLAQSFSATVVVGICRAGGDTRFGLYLEMAVMWCGSILLAALGAFVFHWPIKVVLLVILSDEFLKIPFCIWRFKSQRWLRNVTRQTV